MLDNPKTVASDVAVVAVLLFLETFLRGWFSSALPGSNETWNYSNLNFMGDLPLSVLSLEVLTFVLFPFFFFSTFSTDFLRPKILFLKL